ncbi:13252_t:CDS:2, partial [Entrophospora sp. SA101]
MLWYEQLQENNPNITLLRRIGHTYLLHDDNVSLENFPQHSNLSIFDKENKENQGFYLLAKVEGFQAENSSALIRSGLTVVLSPLKALIDDQLIEFINIGIPSAKLYRSEKQSLTYQENFLSEIGSGLTRILIVTTEKFTNNFTFRNMLKSIKSSRGLSFIVDEAHCILNYDGFCERYNNLDLITREFSDCPIMLLSATVSPHDINAICNKIGINDANLCVVWGIIQEKLPNIKVGKYHGDVQSDKQEEVLINFKKGILQGVIATPGFGMGINIIDICKVIHLAFPLSIGNYIQESGRVARDGNPGQSILFFSHSDLGTLFSVIGVSPESNSEFITERNHKLLDMIFFCENQQKDNPIQFDVEEDALLMVKIVSILVNEVSELTHTDIGYVNTSANNREVHAKKLSKTSVYNNKSLHPAKYIKKQSQALFLLDYLIIHGIVTYNIILKLSKTKNFISGKYHLSHNMFINGICEGAEDK